MLAKAVIKTIMTASAVLTAVNGESSLPIAIDVVDSANGRRTLS